MGLCLLILHIKSWIYYVIFFVKFDLKFNYAYKTNMIGYLDKKYAIILSEVLDDFFSHDFR